MWVRRWNTPSPQPPPPQRNRYVLPIKVKFWLLTLHWATDVILLPCHYATCADLLLLTDLDLSLVESNRASSTSNTAQRRVHPALNRWNLRFNQVYAPRERIQAPFHIDTPRWRAWRTAIRTRYPSNHMQSHYGLPRPRATSNKILFEVFQGLLTQTTCRFSMMQAIPWSWSSESLPGMSTIDWTYRHCSNCIKVSSTSPVLILPFAIMSSTWESQRLY